MNCRHLVLAAGLLTGGAALADNIQGENVFLCAPGYVTHCSSGGDCETVPAHIHNIPDFIKIDLAREMLLSTDASAEEESTPIQSVQKSDGTVYLQGVENARAFTILIVEETGDGSLAIIADGETATAFLACTAD
jgi:hypothetical protein